MLPSHSIEQSAIASQLAADLAEYDQRLGELLRGWDAGLYRTLSDQFDHMHMRAQALPQLTAGWSELVISRVELMHALLSPGMPCRITGKVVAHHARHRAIIQQVLRDCMQYLIQAP
jgi:hypothetical protein